MPSSTGSHRAPATPPDPSSRGAGPAAATSTSIKPSKMAIRRLRERLAAEMRTPRGGNAMTVIATLNPLIQGWAAYHRGVVSSRQFKVLDHCVGPDLQVGH